SQVVQGRAGSRRDAMLDQAVLRRPSVTGAAVASFVLGFVAFGLTFYAAIYIGPVLLNSATETGLKFLPMTAVAFAVAPLGAWLMRRLPVRPLLAGCLVLMAAGSVLLRAVDESSSWTALVPGFVLIGLGSGAIVPPLVSTAVSVVPDPRAGVAAAINNTARQLGIAFGVAGLGTYFQARVAGRLDAVQGVDADALAAVIVGGGFQQAAAAAPEEVRAEVAAAGPDAFFAGLDDLFVVLALVAALGAFIVAVLIRRADFVIPPGGRRTPAEPARELAAVP
ncbi:MAG TPA: MFS transporter, partial [Solirubrobacteraceae bacterium]|nr:MFS transporter [Solirubrobacteraceae bacterium]